jgi:hypothetical protein
MNLCWKFIAQATTVSTSDKKLIFDLLWSSNSFLLGQFHIIELRNPEAQIVRRAKKVVGEFVG